MDKRVMAIRKNAVVGVGSLSVIEACWSDNEIVSELDRRGITTIAAAVKWAYDLDELDKAIYEDVVATRW